MRPRSRPRSPAEARPAAALAAAALLTAVTAALPPAAAAAQRADLATWSYDDLAGGWSAEQLIGSAEVYGAADGGEIGELENLLVGPDGRVRRLVIEAGGFAGVGDAHLAYPWAEAAIVGPERIEVALDEDDAAAYGLFAAIPEDEPLRGRRVWRITELLNDYAVLAGGIEYGWIDDAIVGRDGAILAIVVYPDLAYRPPLGHLRPPPRPVALPFDPEAFEPGLDRYELPYDPEAVAELEPFTYGGAGRE